MTRRTWRTWTTRSLGWLAPLAVVACDDPPPKTASGMRVDYVAFEERFALSTETKSDELKGDKLRRAIALLDKHGVFELTGKTFAAKDVVESGTLVLEVKPSDQPARRITVKSCAEEKICAFFTDAHVEGLVKRKPVVCAASAAPCAKP